MKKLLIGFSQVVVFILCYEIVLNVFTYLLTYLYALLLQIPIVRYWFAFKFMQESTFFTFLPIISGLAIVFIMGFLYQKTGIYLISGILMFAIVSYGVIDTLVYNVQEYGILSWDTLDVVWYDVIFCGILFFGIGGMMNLKKISNIVAAANDTSKYDVEP